MGEHSHIPYPNLRRPDLTSFSALRLLRIQPFVLLGHGGDGVESYAAGTNPSIAELIRRRLPRGLKMLFLEGLTSHPPSPELMIPLFPVDQELIRCRATGKLGAQNEVH